MEWIKRRRYRIPVSYVLAVWLYSIIFAFISGVFPVTVTGWIKFVFTPFFLTIQLPFHYMRGGGWLFTILVGLFATGIYHLLKAIAQRKYPSPTADTPASTEED